MLGSGGERLFLDLWRSRTATILVDGALCLLGVLSSIVLEGLGSVAGMLSCKILDLIGLLARQSASMVELCVNHFLVLDINQRTEIGDGSSDQAQAPKRNKLDEEVRDEGCKEGLKVSC